MDRLQSPPIRTNLQESGTARTVKDWYLYWQRSGEQLNLNTTKLDGLITNGTHEERPNPATMPEGALFIDSSRGNTLYQVQDGEWHYIAGIMLGTISPDQRPTDLGPNDVGFQFRSTDTGQQFYWSGSAWVETVSITYGTHAARPAASSAPPRALYIETDRGNVIYQQQGGAWKYVSGFMTGTIIATDQRPAGLGANDTGFLFLASDATSVQWSGSVWTPIFWQLDVGAAPAASQWRIKSNGLGALAALSYSADNQNLCFDAEFAGGWVARHASCAWLRKTSGFLVFSRSSGNALGATPTLGDAGLLELATGKWSFENNVSAGIGFQVANLQVVGSRKAAITAPSGGTTIDTQARTAIQSILNVLSAAAGGHGLTA